MAEGPPAGEAGPAALIPEPVLAILRAEPGPEQEFDQAIPLLTVDPDGFAHVTLLSRGQLRADPAGRELLASVWGAGTRANLLASGRATVMLADDSAAYYLKLTVTRTIEHAARLGVALAPGRCTSDSVGVQLAPMGFRPSAELAAREGWEADARVLDLLAGTP